MDNEQPEASDPDVKTPGCQSGRCTPAVQRESTTDPSPLSHIETAEFGEIRAEFPREWNERIMKGITSICLHGMDFFIKKLRVQFLAGKLFFLI